MGTYGLSTDGKHPDTLKQIRRTLVTEDTGRLCGTFLGKERWQDIRSLHLLVKLSIIIVILKPG